MQAGRNTAVVLMATVLMAGCGTVRGTVPADLTGTRWLVEDLEGAGVLDRLQSTLEFPEPGAATGNLGCNRFTATWQQSGPGLRFGAVASTRKMCPPAVMDQEQRYAGVLERSRGALLDEPFLYLLDDRGARLARLIRHEDQGDSD
jgi:heat shock protein HslJ